MQRFKSICNKIWPYVVILLGALVLLLPQYISHNMILGADSIFHYNRFYEAAMQIKEGHYDYFLTMYGFQSSGRIINALYGPIVAYFNGLLVLIGKTWFNYQLLSDLAVYLLASGSMYALMRKIKLKKNYSVLIALFYLTTYSIQYWTVSQAFSGWSASILPLCLFPIVTVIQQKKINFFELAVCTALMFQVHFLTSLFVVMIYIPIFLYAFLKNEDKLDFIKRLALAICLYFLLTANVWAGLVEIYGNNNVLQPFINKNMYGTAISLNAYRLTNWLSPLGIVLLGALQLFLAIAYWKKISVLNRLATIEAVVFLILSTRLLPWQWLSQHVSFVNTIQFPFRFFVPYTVLMLLSLGLLLVELKPKFKWTVLCMTFLVLGSFGQTLGSLQHSLMTWDGDEEFMYRKNTIYFSDDLDKIKSSFFSKDLKAGLVYVQKSTPDYLPLYTKLTDQDKIKGYRHYRKQVILQEEKYTKKVVNDSLVYEWNGDFPRKVIVPAIAYHNSKLVLNGQPLSKKDFEPTRIGAVKVLQKTGKNQLVLSYEPFGITKFCILLTPLVWGGCIVWTIYRKGSKKWYEN